MEICMNKKRVTAVILSAMMCMQIFTGCGAKNNAAAVEGGAGQTATESAQGAAGTVTEENAQTAEENVQGTADQDGTEESMTGNDAAEQADSTEVSVPEDGEYTVEVTLEGGSGKATVDSQAKVTVKDGVAYATITWSSTHYDYMIVNGEKYLNENEGGNSTFTFPIDGIPCEMDVIGDTTAMSTPHEIDYTLTFQFPETAGFKDLDCNGRMELSYADQFEVEQYGAYKLITIVDNGRFLLVPKGVKVPADVPADVIVDTAMNEGAKVIGLSALMTTTMMRMKDVVELAKEKGCTAKIVIGGAAITESFSDEIGADGYSKDAAECVKLVERLLA